MKLRIRDNSIRLRLTRGEVDALGKDGPVAARTAFPGGRSFEYRVESSPASVRPEAFLSDSGITVRVPQKSARAWATGDEISLAGDVPLDGGECLRILVEKDFACLVARDGEDESDMFVHPQSKQGGCE